MLLFIVTSWQEVLRNVLINEMITKVAFLVISLNTIYGMLKIFFNSYTKNYKNTRLLISFPF